MKKLSLISLLFVISILTPRIVGAQTLHAIIFAVTNDEKLGKGMKTDMMRMIELLNNVRGATQGEMTLTVCQEEDANGTKLEEVMSGLSVGPDDTVLFFYSGHGAHADNDPDPWPTMCLSGLSRQGKRTDYVKMSEIDKRIAALNPRLRFVFSHSCNMPPSGMESATRLESAAEPARLSEYDPEVFIKLFYKDRGRIQHTSSQLGEYSWSVNEIGMGGLHFNDFLYVMEQAGRKEIPADWGVILAKAKDITSRREDIWAGTPRKQYKQHPYYEYTVNGKTSINGKERPDGNVKPREEERPRNRDNDFKPKPKPEDIETLENALQMLSNQRLSVERRLSMIPKVIARYFYPGAHVKTVAHNGHTPLDYEDAETFMRRVVGSPFIYQINLLDGKTSDKNRQITVSELRND